MLDSALVCGIVEEREIHITFLHMLLIRYKWVLLSSTFPTYVGLIRELRLDGMCWKASGTIQWMVVVKRAETMLTMVHGFLCYIEAA
jgi:hypothetical protein